MVVCVNLHHRQHKIPPRPIEIKRVLPPSTPLNHFNFSNKGILHAIITYTQLLFHSSQPPPFPVGPKEYQSHHRQKVYIYEKGKKMKFVHTTAGILWWSPTQLLINRSEACVWQSGRDAQFSSVYGRMLKCVVVVWGYGLSITSRWNNNTHICTTAEYLQKLGLYCTEIICP